MNKWIRYIGQAVVYGAVAAGIGYFASNPWIEQFPSDSAQLKLSFAHGAQRKEECRRLTPEEIAKLPPNMRRPTTCGRERVPIRVQLVVDGKPIYDEILKPTGLAGDGPARVYQKFVVPPGRREIVARLRDSTRTEGFDYERRHTVELEPLQSLAIDFRADQGTFVFR